MCCAAAQSLTVGDTATLTATAHYNDDASETITASWQSSDLSVVTVHPSSGVVTAVGVGTATITVSAENRTRTFPITVSAARTITSLSVTLSSSSVMVGTAVTVTATATYTDGVSETVTPTWTSSDPSVASVSASGLIATLTAGSVTITASYEGQSASAGLVVEPQGPKTTFGAGQYLVGSDIAAGRYYTDPASDCYWERQSGLGGTLSDIIANEFIGFDAGQWIVDILSSDKAFETDSDCRTWYSTSRRGMQANITQGLWLVGEQIQPGTYSATVSAGCYWERREDFTGELSGIIANDFVSDAGNQLVEIKASDEGFQTDDDCGTWTRVSGVTAMTPTSSRQSRSEIETNRSLYRRDTGFHNGR